MDCGNDPTIGLTSDFTLAAWFNADSSSLSGANRNIVARQDNVGAFYGLEIQNQDQSARSGYCGATHSPGAGVWSVWSCDPSPTPAATWHHAVGVFHAGQQVEIYVDGAFAAATPTTTTSVMSGSAHLFIALNTSGSRPTFQGTLDDIRVYGRALSNAEISSLYGGTPDGGIAADSGPDGTVADGASE
jgi:beta-galactosidase